MPYWDIIMILSLLFAATVTPYARVSVEQAPRLSVHSPCAGHVSSPQLPHAPAQSTDAAPAPATTSSANPALFVTTVKAGPPNVGGLVGVHAPMVWAISVVSASSGLMLPSAAGATSNVTTIEPATTETYSREECTAQLSARVRAWV